MINTLGAEGVIRAAENLVEGKALGGYIPGYEKGGLNAFDAMHKYLKNKDSSQSFLNKLLFGTKYNDDSMKMLSGEVPFGPGNIVKGLYKIPNAISGILNYFKKLIQLL